MQEVVSQDLFYIPSGPSMLSLLKTPKTPSENCLSSQKPKEEICTHTAWISIWMTKRQAISTDAFQAYYTDRNFVDNFLQVVIYLALVANI